MSGTASWVLTVVGLGAMVTAVRAGVRRVPVVVSGGTLLGLRAVAALLGQAGS